MNFGDIIGQVFRDYTGMPPKVNSYNNRISVYQEISDNVSNVETNSIKYLNEIGFIDWKIIDAKRIKLDSDLSRGLISPQDYVLMLNDLELERKQVLNDFVSSTDQYFVTAYKNRLYTIKSQNSRNEYIRLMNFDTWFEMEEAREIADYAALQIRSSDKYIDAKKIAEIREKYLRERHMRRGR